MSRSQSRKNNNPRAVRLPLGMLTGGRRYRTALLRQRSQADALRFVDLDLQAPRERVLSEVLAACLAWIGPRCAPTAEQCHALAFVDRHELVRTLLVEDGVLELTATATCSGCGKVLELSFDVAAHAAPSLKRTSVELVRTVGDIVERRRMRLPAPIDVEAASDPLDVLALCLDCTKGEAEGWQVAADATLAVLDPLGELTLVGACPSCDVELVAAIDLVAAWLARLYNAAIRLLADVHELAKHYHWSEREVLDLPYRRRMAYLDLCDARPIGLDAVS